MQRLKANLTIASQILGYHAFLCTKYTAYVMFTIYVIGLCVMSVIGVPINYLYFKEHRLIVLAVFLVIYSLPANLYAIRLVLNHEFENFRIIIEAKQKSTEGESK